MTIDTAALRRLAEAATPDDWAFDGNCGGYIEQGGARIARAYALRDAAFIAAANPAAIIALLDRLEAVERERDRLRALLRDEKTDMAWGQKP